MQNEISIFCPATVANVSCGYDVLGFCLDGIGDIMKVTKKEEQGITIEHHDKFNINTNPYQNVAGISAMAMLDSIDYQNGFHIEIHKNIKPGSGIGSSAASATGSVFAINELLGRPFTKTELVTFAIKGEAFASGCEHADNLAPAIFGGFTLVKSLKPLKILELPTPNNLYATILHPQIEVKTSEAKNILPKEFPIKDAISQWANVGSLVHALHMSDYELLSESLQDFIAEPYRMKYIPNFKELKESAVNAGALGCGISGSGPSVFALSKGIETAEKVCEAMKEVYAKTDIKFETYVSPINLEGIKEISA